MSTSDANRKPAAGRASLRALQLLGRWMRLAEGHIVLGAGCLCGASLGAVRPGDYDEQIMGYLLGRHGWAASLDHAKLDHLLAAIGKGGTGASARACAALLDDVERSLDSFDAAHGDRLKGVR